MTGLLFCYFIILFSINFWSTIFYPVSITHFCNFCWVFWKIIYIKYIIINLHSFGKQWFRILEFSRPLKLCSGTIYSNVWWMSALNNFILKKKTKKTCKIRFIIKYLKNCIFSIKNIILAQIISYFQCKQWLFTKQFLILFTN